jgi:hypothetical protein
MYAEYENHIATMWPGDAPSPNQILPFDFFPWGSTRPKGSFRLDGLGSHGLIPDHHGKNQIPTIRFVGIEELTNPDFFDTPGPGSRNPDRANKGDAEPRYNN